ncbi:MAG: type II toxin-antitoxin system VapC family toxin [Leptolyngbyaceae bacterium]|nr:type II toxin-antitoxin system VapC family toxin [Leptolyngbyaceae bacterium]
MTTSIVCIDASFVIRLISQPAESPYRKKWSQWQNIGITIVAPALIFYEVSNAFHRSAVVGQILAEEADEALESALSLGITLYNDSELHCRALQLAHQLNLPAAYDAHYLALAERLDAQFWTSDRRLVNAVQTTLTWVNLVV